MRRLTIVLLAAIVTVLVGAVGALAAVTIGPAEPNPSPSTAHSPYSPSGRLLFNKTAPAGTVLTTPSEGTITSWRFYTNEVGADATAQLYALTPAGGESFTVVAIGPKEPLMPAAPQESSPEFQNVLQAFSSDLKVPAGALLGVRVEYPGASTVDPVFYFNSPWSAGCLGGNCAEPPGVPAVGGTATAVSYAQEMAMNATFEPAPTTGGSTAPTCVGACAAPTTPTPTPVKPAPPLKKCPKGKALKKVHGAEKCVKKKHHKHKTKPKQK